MGDGDSLGLGEFARTENNCVGHVGWKIMTGKSPMQLFSMHPIC